MSAAGRGDQRSSGLFWSGPCLLLLSRVNVPINKEIVSWPW